MNQSSEKPVSKFAFSNATCARYTLHHLNGHENIVGLSDAYEGSKHIYIVMEMCSGGRVGTFHVMLQR